MANNIGWGKGTQNNSNGWGKFQNTIGAASVYAVSYAGETVIEGTSAAFSYSASSFHQGEADPTPTITGTAGGTFSATPSGLSINTSTGTIDLDNSTIQSYTITYTVGGVSANQTLAVTASPFIANNFSMQFNRANGTYITTGVNVAANDSFSVSFWVKGGTPAGFTNNNAFGIGQGGNSTPGRLWSNRFIIQSQDNNGANFGNRVVDIDIYDGNWHHLAFTRDGTTGQYFAYTAGANVQWTGVFGANNAPSITLTSAATNNQFQAGDLFLGTANGNTTYSFDGKVDEFAFWNTVLEETAIQEIYNATANNTGKVLDLNTDSGNYNASSNLVYFNRLGD